MEAYSYRDEKIKKLTQISKALESIYEKYDGFLGELNGEFQDFSSSEEYSRENRQIALDMKQTIQNVKESMNFLDEALGTAQQIATDL